MPTIKEARVNRRLRKAADRRASDVHIDPTTGKSTTGVALKRIIQRRQDQSAKVQAKKESRRRQAKRSPWQKGIASGAFAMKLDAQGKQVVNGQIKDKGEE